MGAQLYYEAAVGGAIPIIRPLRDSLAGDRVDRILGIVNGTTNFILDRMDHDRATSLEEALADRHRARLRRGRPHRRHRRLRRRAEGGDPREPRLPHERAARRGAPRGHHRRHRRAGRVGPQRPGYVVKLLAICERLIDAETGDEGVCARVYPALVPRSHPLAAVHGANNAVFVEAEAAGPLMFYGAGAGGVQTASAVLGDLVSAARRHVIGGPGVAESTHAELPVLPISGASRPATRSRSRSPTSRACSRGSRTSSPSTASRSSSSQQTVRRCGVRADRYAGHRDA